MSGYSPLVERALRVASQAHAAQRRKGSDIPYITHPVHVALLLCDAGWTDEIVLAAALLHDVVEDTSVTLDDLRRDFPEATVAIVAGLSEHKQDDQGQTRPWEERKREHLAEVATASPAIRAVTLADKLHNLETLLADAAQGAEVWRRFNGTPPQLLWYYRSMLAAASGEEPELQPLIVALRQAVERLEQLLHSSGLA